MFAVPSAALLDAVDRGRGVGWLDRGLVLAALAGDEPARLADEPIGRLQEAALLVHASIAGDELEATTVCPQCAAVVEFALPVAALLRVDGSSSEGCLDLGAFELTWHAPTTADLRLAGEAVDPSTTLRARCVTATMDGREVTASDLPAEVLLAAERAMADADPLAEVLAAVVCPECGAEFDADVDPIGFVWAEAEARAVRLLHEVDDLARAYGWTEDVILALPPARRTAYLAIVRGDAP